MQPFFPSTKHQVRHPLRHLLHISYIFKDFNFSHDPSAYIFSNRALCILVYNGFTLEALSSLSLKLHQMTLFVINFSLLVLLVTAPFLFQYFVCCSRGNDRGVSCTRRRIYLECHGYTTRVAKYDGNIKLNNIHFEEWLL